jgi:LPXTG-motif cell wall-anchored protein
MSKPKRAADSLLAFPLRSVGPGNATWTIGNETREELEMKKIAMFCSVVGLCVVTATAIFAQSDPTPAPADTNRNSMLDNNANSTSSVTGKVLSINGNTLMVETDSGDRMTFDTNGTTLPYGASVGSRVQVAYAPNQTDNVKRLSSVTVVPATDTAVAENRYNSTPPAGSMNTNRTGATNTNNSDMYASNRHLPKTGSLTPLFGLLGIIALGAGLAVRIVRSLS